MSESSDSRPGSAGALFLLGLDVVPQKISSNSVKNSFGYSDHECQTRRTRRIFS